MSNPKEETQKPARDFANQGDSGGKQGCGGRGCGFSRLMETAVRHLIEKAL